MEVRKSDLAATWCIDESNSILPSSRRVIADVLSVENESVKIGLWNRTVFEGRANNMTWIDLDVRHPQLALLY